MMTMMIVVVVPSRPPIPVEQPCNPSPCGTNAVCKELHGAGSCACYDGYVGDPYVGCRPECVQNSECAWDKACVNNKCRNPCVGACGLHADCKVTHHTPACFCPDGFTGNPLSSCRKIIHNTSKTSSIRTHTYDTLARTRLSIFIEVALLFDFFFIFLLFF